MSEIHTGVHEMLKGKAQRGEITTYSAVAPVAGLDMSHSRDRERMRLLLNTVSEAEHQAGRPLLSAVVVRQENGLSGPRFFNLAKKLRLFDGRDRDAFFVEELRKVHAAWRGAP